jgi:hypothetical protein
VTDNKEKRAEEVVYKRNNIGLDVGKGVVPGRKNHNTVVEGGCPPFHFSHCNNDRTEP